jgi:hypothetical protein
MTTAAKISIQIDAQTATLQKGFAEARGAIQKLDSSMSSHVAYGMAKFQVGMLAVRGVIAGASGIINSFKQSIDEMSNLEDFSARLGMSSDELRVLQFAAKQTGSSIETMNVALQKMEVVISKGSKSLKALGLSAALLRRLSPKEQFGAIAEAMSRVKLSTDRTRLAVDIFGRAGGELNNVLRGGKAGLADFNKEAERLGLLMGDNRAAVEAAGDAIDRAADSWGAFKARAAIALAPGIEMYSDWLSAMMGSWNKWWDNEPKKIVGSTKVLARKAARAAAEELDKVQKIPGIGPAARGTAAGFSAYQETERAKKADEERRHREHIGWLDRIERAVREDVIEIAPVNV